MSKEEVYNKIEVTIAKDYEEMSQLAAKLILKKIHDSKLKINLLVPTGSTPKGVYSILKKQPRKTFRDVRFFNMDEYCDGKKLISEKNPVSFRLFMKKYLFNSIGPVKNHFPEIENIKQEGFYDKGIKKYGGIDFCLNALGRDGHTLGFNFPGTSFNSRTRLVKINDETKRVDEEETGYKTPEYAITTGLKTGIESKEILFLVSGKEKADILRKVIYMKPTSRIPATILKLHSKCQWIVDEEAASKL